MKKSKVLLFVFFSFYSLLASAQNFYAIDTIQKIEISFTQSNWDYLLDTAKQGSDSYTMAQWVKINGFLFDSVGVKYKGNSSFNPNNAKNPLHIELDHFKNQDYMGYKDIKLSNGYHEPTLIREVLSYALLKNYMPASQANFAQVYINGQYFGIYSNVEAVTKTFIDSRFYSNNNSFFFMDNGGCNLVYKGADTTLYYNPYTLKSDYGWTDLKDFCYTLNNNTSAIENVLDVDRTLWMLVFTNVTVTLDSYLGQSTHNYYMYEDHNGRFNPIIWDLNGGFGIFNKVNGNVQLTVPQMQTMPPMLHANDSLWPLVKKLLAVPLYKKMYMAHMRTIINENFADTSYFAYAQYLQSIIDTAVQSDTKKFYTYAQFLSNMTTTVIDGPKTIPGLSELMNVRTAFLKSTVELQKVPPVIIGIQSSVPTPPLNSNFYITADVSDATTVLLGIRNSKMDKFTRMTMYDDGTHGDGAAGDGNYGVSVTMTNLEIQYYIFAENNDAGVFSPERAEYEYYNLTSGFDYILSGDVVINEVLAINDNTIELTSGQYSDWVELYNNTGDTVALDFLYLSDDILSPQKWQFPSGSVILPHGYEIVWAADGIVPGEHLSGFNFSGNGEQVILSYDGASILDSITFPVQTTDISWGRYPNGTGNFGYMPPTFNAVNTHLGMGDLSNKNQSISIYPNPSNGVFQIKMKQTDKTNLKSIDIYNTMGEKIFNSTNLLSLKSQFDLSTQPDGIYFIQAVVGIKIYSQKILICH